MLLHKNPIPAVLKTRPHTYPWAPPNPEVSPMHPAPRLLTIILECQGKLDREGVTYRRLLNARLKAEDQYNIHLHDGNLDTTSIHEYSRTIKSKYIFFVRSTHEISSNFLATLLRHLKIKPSTLPNPSFLAAKYLTVLTRMRQLHTRAILTFTA